jgi:Icc-related predicted phosphoesterase
MRLMVIADISPTLMGMSLPNYVAAKRIDAVITAGDLSRAKLAGIDALSVPTMGVYGNHCDGKYLEDLGVTNLHLSITTVCGVVFAGLQGCVRYKKDPTALLYTQREYRDLIAALPAADVLVTHCPPRGINDHDDPAHVGIDALRDWLDQTQPAVLIHGHTYPERPVKQYRSTRMEYVYGGRIIAI